MGCQVEIADKIVGHQADYLLRSRPIGPALEADVMDYFRTAPAAELVTTTAVEKGHGRIETRTYTASKVTDWIVSEADSGGPRARPPIKIIKPLILLYNFGEWCNGSTTDSDSVCLGSNPSSPATVFRSSTTT